MTAPDIEGNELFDTRARNTSNPVTKLDIVGGRRWRVRANYIHDFAKGGGDTVSYAALFKGNSRDGLMERNLVVCSRLHTGGTRIGLSFGGGGTSPDSIWAAMMTEAAAVAAATVRVRTARSRCAC